MKTLLFVRTENNSAYDGSVTGTALKLNGPVTSTKVENQFQLSQGFLETGPMPELETSGGAFTVEALITPDAVLGSRQNIMESQKPPIAFFIDDKGFLNGSINLAAGGWKSVKSNVPLVAGKSQRVRFSRDAAGLTNLEVDDKNVGS